MQHFREKLPENRGVSIAKKLAATFLKLPQLAMTDGQYYGARKLCHNIAAIYCCVCHRPNFKKLPQVFFAIETPLFSGNFSRKCCIVIGQLLFMLMFIVCVV